MIDLMDSQYRPTLEEISAHVRAEAVLADGCAELAGLYRATKECNGQRWLMIDLQDCDALYRDTLRLIALRRGIGA